MTTNQTIDGVPRELLERVLYDPSPRAQEQALDELRALLDAPGIEVRDKCGVQMVDCPECSHQWDHFFECGNKPAAQPQGEPVAMSRDQFEAWVLGREHPTYGWLDKHWLTRGDNPETYATEYVQGLWVASQTLYAEQPAPVAEQLIERLAQRFPNLENMYTVEIFADWLRAELNPSL